MIKFRYTVIALSVLFYLMLAGPTSVKYEGVDMNHKDLLAVHTQAYR
ncbi:MAG TPA: hypothetical protein VNJ01_05765 [Bacteriovoracaceae bacterium]|nr:hypothetical protein [Bacteriovoracaceae bacterium]